MNMPGTSAQETYYQDEPLDLFELWNILWESKFLIVGITLAFAFGSVFYALAQIDIYRSEALLVPAEDTQPSNPLLAQLGAAAGLAGIGAADSRGNQINTALATMRSREFIRQFIEKHDAKPSLMAGVWNENNGSSSIDQSVYDSETKTWMAAEPTDQEAIRAFQSVLSIAYDQAGGLVTVAIEWKDPQLAKNWVSWLVEDVNELIKKQDEIEATSAIEYLNEQLQNTQLVDMQRAFYQLIESQTRIVMLTDVRDDYVFRTIDPAFVPEDKIRPRRSTICIVGTLLGGIFAIMLVLLLHAFKKRYMLIDK